jgi:choline transport protein
MSLIGLASTTTISWTGLGLGIVTAINAGGPGAIIYGFIFVTVLQCFLGSSLAEFVSSYPTEGGSKSHAKLHDCQCLAPHSEGT